MSDADNSDPKPKKRAATKKTAKVEAPVVDDWTPSAPSVRAATKPESYDGVPNGQSDAQGRKEGLWVFREASGAVAEEHYREGFFTERSAASAPTDCSSASGNWSPIPTRSRSARPVAG